MPEDAISYRALDSHVGCTTEGVKYTPAQLPGYRCAAKQYPFPAGVSEDTSKPIVILVHGNSSSPADFEAYTGTCTNKDIPNPNRGPMLAERLAAAGYRTYAADLRVDRVDDPPDKNPARNVSHGWATPIAAHLIESVLEANPGRKISLVGFSLGSTVTRDALRRLYAQGKNPFPRLQDVVLLAGGHHGVSTYRKYCTPEPEMNHRAACELGDRTAFVPTPFLSALNGEAGAWETPCADGKTAYGNQDACGGNAVRYLTVVMRDVAQGTYQDEFVSESSSALNGADNLKVQLTDNDDTCHFLNGLFRNHYGALRSEAAMRLILDRLARPLDR